MVTVFLALEDSTHRVFNFITTIYSFSLTTNGLEGKKLRCFYVSLTVHLSITLVDDQLDAQILFITILYMYKFEQYLAHPQEVKLY